MIETVLLLITGIALSYVTLLMFFLRQKIIQKHRRFNQRAAYIKRVQFKRNQKLETQKLVETSIDRGAEVVEQVHQLISDAVYQSLAVFTSNSKSTEKVKRIHDSTASIVYRTIRETNREMGRISKQVL